MKISLALKDSGDQNTNHIVISPIDCQTVDNTHTMTTQGEGDFLTRIRVGSKSRNYFEIRAKITKLLIELMDYISLSGLRFWKGTKIEALLHTIEIESLKKRAFSLA